MNAISGLRAVETRSEQIETLTEDAASDYREDQN